MLSPEEIQQARQQYGVGKTATASGGSGFGSQQPVDHASRMARLRGLSVSKPSQASENQPSQEKSFFEKAADYEKNGGFTAGVLKGAGSTLAGIGSLGEKALNKATEALFPKNLSKEQVEGPTVGQQLQEGALKPEGAMQNLGFGAEQAGEFLMPTGAAGAAEKAVEGSKLLANAPKIVKSGLGLVAKAGTEGLEQAARTAAQEGEINGNVAAAGAIGAASPVLEKTIASAADKLGNFFYSRTVPTTIKESARDLRKNLDIGESLSKTGVSMTKKSLLEKVGTEAKKLGGSLDDLIDSHVAKNAADVRIEDFTGKVRKALSEGELDKKLRLSPIDAKQAKEAVLSRLDEYEKMFSGKTMNADDVQKLKVGLGDSLEKVYAMALDAPVKAKALTDVTLRSQLRSYLEKAVPGVKEVNQKLAPLLEARGRMMEKGAYSGYLTDMIAGSMAAGGSPMDIVSDPVGYAKKFAEGVIFKRLGTSTLAKTLAGKVSKDMAKFFASPQALQMFRRIAESGIQGD